MFSLTLTFASIFLKYVNRVCIINVISVESTALISSRLDYCNSQLNTIIKRNLAKLQRVQHCLARVVLRAPRFLPPLPLLQQLHWLPVTYRINFNNNNNNHPTWLVSCIFQISTGSSYHQFHNNLLCLKQNFTWANVLSLSLRLGSGMNSPSI